MRFWVRPDRYTVRISDGALHDEQGQEVWGLCDFADHVIWISGTLPPRSRATVLFHELRHAWDAGYGRPGDHEGHCDNSASFAIDVMRQLQAQGGEPALMRLTSGGVVDHCSTADVPAAPVGAECAKCSTRFSPQQVVTEPAEMSPTAGLLVVKRGVYCDFCGHVQHWTEAATQNGHPTGQVLGGPAFTSGEAVAEFIRLHPQATGMIVA